MEKEVFEVFGLEETKVGKFLKKLPVFCKVKDEVKDQISRAIQFPYYDELANKTGTYSRKDIHSGNEFKRIEFLFSAIKQEDHDALSLVYCEKWLHLCMLSGYMRKDLNAGHEEKITILTKQIQSIEDSVPEISEEYNAEVAKTAWWAD